MKGTSRHVYDCPRYYEIAFSFRDINHEVDVLEDCMRKYSVVKVEKVLEIGSGNSPHMLEILKRGYSYIGVELNREMIAYSTQKAASVNGDAVFHCAGMAEFDIGHTVDFAFVALGSLYVKTTEELVSHFDSMAKTLRPGGLYLMDWCVTFDPITNAQPSWQMQRDGISVHATCEYEMVDRVEQTVKETIRLAVDDNGVRSTLAEESMRKTIYPQEFLQFVANRPDFEFVGWWNNWDLESPILGTERINRPITIVRRA